MVNGFPTPTGGGATYLALLRVPPVLPGVPNPEDANLATQDLVADQIATRSEGYRKLAHVKA